MPANRFHLLALPITIGALALAACGGGDSPGDSGNTGPTLREAALKHRALHAGARH